METTIDNLISLQGTHGFPHKAMAETFGVSPKTWGKINRRENWKNGIPEKHQGTATDFIQKYNGHDLEEQPTPSEPESESTAIDTSDDADTQGIASPLPDDSTDVPDDTDWDDIDDSAAAAAGDGDGDTGSELDGMVEYVHSEIAGWDARPTAGDVHKLMETVVWDGASKAVRDALFDGLDERWPKTFRRTTLNPDWTALEREYKKEQKQIAEQEKSNAQVERVEKEEPMTEVERAAVYAQFGVDSDVMTVAEKPNILDHVVDTLHSSGLAGERDAIELIYLSATARVLDKPIHPLIAGTSGGGKSEITDRTLKLFPEEDVIFRTSLSAKSLFYRTGHLEHRVLYLAEASQLENDDNNDMAATVRELQSRGYVVHEVTETDPETGEKYTAEHICKGPTTLVLTTTATTLHSENETRMLRLHITETAKHTKNVFGAMGKKAAGRIGSNDDAITTLQNFQRWIAAGPRDALIPFAEALMSLMPPAAVAMRRSAGHMLQLICAHAVLHQKTREMEGGAVLATLDDYEAIRAIITRSMAEAVGQAPTEPVVTLVKYIYARLDEQAAEAAQKQPTSKPSGRRSAAVINNRYSHEDTPTVLVSRGDLVIALGTNDSAVHRTILAATKAGYIQNMQTIKGRTAKWAKGNRDLGAYDPDCFFTNRCRCIRKHPRRGIGCVLFFYSIGPFLKQPKQANSIRYKR